MSVAAPQALTAPRPSPEQLASQRGHLARAFLHSSEVDLELAYEPGADLDGRFEATCLDTGDPLLVNGWLFVIEQAA